MAVGRLLGIRGLVIIRLVEQEVGSEFFVLVAGEVSLDGLVAVEAQAAKLSPVSTNCLDSSDGENTHSLNGVPLLLGHGDSLSPRGQWGVIISVLTEQAEELLGVLGYQLGQLRVASSKLLQDRLQHLRLLLDNLAKLLELGVVSQEIQVTESLPASSCRGNGGSSSRPSTASTSPARATSSLLCG